jgi:hypothetical protein
MLHSVALFRLPKKRSSLFRLLPLTVGLLPLFASGFAEASPQYGINAVYYEINDIPPTMSDVLYPSCGREIENNLNRNFEGEPFTPCPDDMFMIHYTGFITIPDGVESVRFGIASDDGSDVTIGGSNFGSWTDKGCSVDYSDRVVLPTNQPLELDAWFYENGGGTCFMLFWQFNGDNQDWEIVPDEAFTTNGQVATTTSSSTTEVSTTTSSSSSSSSTTSIPEISVVTAPPVIITTLPDNQYTNDTTVENTVESTISPTTTYETPAVTIPTPDTVIETPVDTVVETPTDTIPETTPEPVPVPEELVQALQDADVSSMTTEEFSQALETVLENPVSDEQFSEIITAVLDEPLTDEQFTALVDVLESDTITEEQVASAVDSIIELGITAEQATELATSEKVLESIDGEQATEIFAEVAVDQITEEQAQEIVDAVQDAPTEVKEAFEAEINIYEGKFDTYVPIGSTIPVSTRRVLVAVAGAFFVVPVTTTSASGKRN